MTSLNSLRQRDSVHVASDAAGYDGDGVIEAFFLKQLALPHLSCVIGSRGDPRATHHIAMTLAGLYRDFDDMIAGVEHVMPEIMETLPPNDLNPRCDILLAGWSSEHRKPQSYFMQTAANEWRPDEALAGDLMNPEPFTLIPLPEYSFSPAVTAEAMREAMPAGRVVRGPDDLDPAVDLLRVLEVQRQSRCARAPDGPERSWIGGFAVLTSITESEVRSRIVARWDEDRIGEHIEPAPVDWAEWNSAHPLPGKVETLSKLREQMLQRKAAKLAR